MASKIEWTDESPNPLHVATGGHYCEKISLGCKNCYAERMNRNPYFKGNGQPYRIQLDGQHPIMDINTDMISSWARRRKPKKHFVCSMTDMFGQWVPGDYIMRLLGAMSLAPKQTFQLLTKRPEIAQGMISQWCRVMNRDSLPENIWLGTSAENQAYFQSRLPWLLKTQVQVRFLSLEPLLGPIRFTKQDLSNDIRWIIIGGESGPHARPLDTQWVRDILEQCRQASIPAFVKQLGSHWAQQVQAKDRKGGEPGEWPPDLRIRMFPDHRWIN